MSLPAEDPPHPHAQAGFAPGALERGAALVGPLLAGLGLIMWLAANWDGFGRYGRFAVVAAALAAALVGALALRRARPGFLLLAFLATGGLLALIGQTYQTGADPWSLFAVWAVLTLPFALAARSDAVWTGWIIVALAGITLWAHNTGGGLFDARLGAGVVLTTWALALGLCSLLSPWSPLRRQLGDTGWAWRIGLWLTATQVCLFACLAITVRTDLMIYLGGCALLGGIAALIFRHRPFDLIAAAIVGLMIDVTLIVGIGRLLFSTRDGAIFAMWLIGFAAAAIVAGTAAIILKQTRADADGVPSPADGGTPWPIAVMTAFGALIAAIPLISFYGLFVSMFSGDRFFDRGPMMHIAGLVTLAICVIVLRKPTLGRFAEMFTLIFAVTGLAQIVFATFRDLPPGLAATLLALGAAGLAVVIPRRWIVMLLGVAAGGLAAAALALLIVGLAGLPVAGELIGRRLPDTAWKFQLLQAAECVLLVSVVVALVSRFSAARPRLGVFLTGWTVAILVIQALSSGQTFLLGAFTGLPNREVTLMGGIPLSFRILPLLLAAAGLAWLMRLRPGLLTPLLAGLSGTALIMTALQPLFGPVVFIAAVMLATDRRRLALLAGLVALWILGAWYYAVTLPLTHKGLILIGLGAALGGLALLTRGSASRAGSVGLPEAGTPALSAAFAPALIALGGLAIAGLAGWSIWDKERILRDGRMVMLRIVPVDPRSLLQGDYMTLAFELPERRASPSARQPGGPQPVAVGTVGPDQVVRMTEIVTKRPALAPDQIAIALSIKNGAYVVGSDAWFFKEGEAKRFSGARYGIFRVTPDGTALLAGLADEQRQPIR
jgi:uncharacterized membrane-anchored protein